ncbi:MAG: hypothetical protein AB9856_01800 [Cellulosilyticaceae bacterium]
MASRIMHYTVAHIIAENLTIKDKNKFILGNLEPDLSHQADGSYLAAHFIRKNNELMTKGLDWVEFTEQYKESILEDDEVLGYFVHLITDACWVKNIRDKHIRKYSVEKRKELTSKGYREMYMYNGVFIHRYQLKNAIHEINKLKVDEANIKYKDSLINGLITDFAQTQILNEEFEVYPYKDVMEFIQLSAQKSIDEINALRMNKSLSNPEEFYVAQ